MASVPPRTERRRARPGSLQRPVNGRLYRGTWLLVALPLLLAAFSVARPTPLPPPNLPPAFDRATALALATDLAQSYPNRVPGTASALAAERWFSDPLSPYRDGVVAVLNLDAIASTGAPRLEFAGDTPRSPAASLVETVAAQIQLETGHLPARPSLLRQLIDLGFPFSLYGQAPFVARGI